MYSNIFDTIRAKGMNFFNVEGTLYASILSGMHPVFSLNQVVDNHAFIILCQQHPEVLELIEHGMIRIAPYKDFKDKRGNPVDPILSYMMNALTYPNPEEDRAPFEFSSMAFLKKYQPEETRAIFDRMKKVLTKELKFFDTNLEYADKSFPLTGSKHHKEIELITKHLITIQKIQEAAQGVYLPTRKNLPENNTLSQQLTYAAGKLRKSDKSVEPSFLEGVNELLGYIRANKKNRNLIESRSNLHYQIDRMDHTGRYSEELKEFVNVCYNEVVARSLNDNREKDIIAADNGHSNIGIYVQGEDPDYLASGQKLELLTNAPTNTDMLSWRTLKSVLEEVNASNVSAEKWKECMEDILWKHEIKSLKLAGRQFIFGCFRFAVTAGLSYFDIQELRSESRLNKWESIKIGLYGADVGMDISDALNRLKNGTDYVKEAHRYSQMQDCLVQTNYLRSDYAAEEKK